MADGTAAERVGKGEDSGCGGVGLSSSFMLLVQVFQTGMAVLSKLALNQGMSVFPFLVYRNVLGAACVSCFALIFERDKVRKLNLRGSVWVFMNSFIGLTLAMGFYYYGLRDTSAAYSSIFLNLIPVATFILSAILRVERLALRRASGFLRVLGTVVCVGGAMVISIYKGRVLHVWSFSIDVTHELSGVKRAANLNLPRGTSFLTASCISYAFWFVLQVKMFEAFPSLYWSAALTCVAGSLQSLAAGLCINRERSEWMVRSRLELATVVYAALLNTAATLVIVTWTVNKRGPIFPSIFSPLSLIFITIVESLIMGLEITVGSLLGMFLIVAGIYVFLWGKTREIKEIRSKARSPSVGAGDLGMLPSLALTPAIADGKQASAPPKAEKLPV